MSVPPVPLLDASPIPDFIEIFDDDTDKTIRQRIAAKLNTIPEWIWVNGSRYYALKNQVESFMSSKGDKSFDTFVEKHFNNNISTNPYMPTERESLRLNLDPTDIAKYWLSVQPHDRMIDPNFLIPIVLNFRKHKIDMIDGISDEKAQEVILRFYNDRKGFMDDLLLSVKSNAALANSLEAHQTTLKKLVPRKHFEFQQLTVTLEIKTNVKEKNISLSTIFANIVCDQHAPFFSYHDVYKVVDDLPFLLPLLDQKKKEDEWDLSNPNIIRGHISHLSDDEDEDDKSNYSNCYLLFQSKESEDDKTLLMIVEINYKANENKQSKKTRVVNRLQNAMRYVFQDFSTFHQSEEDVIGIVIFPDISFNSIILSDMIMNDGIFSTIMSVDESEQTSKKKEGLYTHFFIDKLNGTCDISSKIANKANQELKFIKFVEDLPPGKPFIRVRISFKKNMDIINKFIMILSKLLTYYKNNESSIRTLYEKYGIDIDDEEGEDDVEETKVVKKDVEKVGKKGKKKEDFSLKERFPDIFVATYSGACDNNRVMKPIDKKNITGDEYKEWMRFPRDSENYFSCSHNKKYPFIGVMANNLSNKDEYPYLPCCFKTNQRFKKEQERDSSLNDYLADILPQKTTIQQNVIVTNKFALNNATGELPSSISVLLQTIRRVDDGYKFLRKGVLDTPLSFLNCVLKATPQFNIDEIDETRKMKKEYEQLIREYKKLVELDIMCVASQENPGESVNDMRRTLRKEGYMDPRRWIRLLEVVYQVKIIIFSKHLKTHHVSIQLPHHEKNYLRWSDPAKSIVCIYEHYGVDTNPRCELIVGQPPEYGKLTENYFIRAHLNIDGFYDNMLSQWYYNENSNDDKKYDGDEGSYVSPIMAFKVLPFIRKSDKQAVDSYGKTRAILINNSFVILTSPLPCLSLPAISDNNDYDIYQSYDITNEDIQNFLLRYNPSAITVNSNNQIIELHFYIDEMTLTIKTKPFDHDDRHSKRLTQPLYPSSDQNSIIDHIEKARLASMMIEYFLYFFSWYCRTSGLTAEQVASDKKGALIMFKESLVVKEKVMYSIPQTSNVSIAVLKATHFISDDDKFVIDSKESRKRLLYTLYTNLTNHFQTVMSYVDQSEIHHFYSAVSDYAIHTDHTLIVNDLDSLQIVNGDVYNTLQRKTDLFFMKNEMISSTPVQVKTSSSREEAVMKGMRRGCTNVDNEDECPVRYFLYQSRNEVDVYGTKQETNADVLVYKVDQKLHYNGIVIL